MLCVVVCRFIKHRLVSDGSLRFRGRKKYFEKNIFILFLFKLDRRVLAAVGTCFCCCCCHYAQQKFDRCETTDISRNERYREKISRHGCFFSLATNCSKIYDAVSVVAAHRVAWRRLPLLRHQSAVSFHLCRKTLIFMSTRVTTKRLCQNASVQLFTRCLFFSSFFWATLFVLNVIYITSELLLVYHAEFTGFLKRFT